MSNYTRKLIHLLFGMVLFLYLSCKKEKAAEPINKELYPVTFDLGAFSNEIMPLSELQSPSTQEHTHNSNPSIGFITYRIFDNKNTVVASGDFAVSNSGKLGSIKDELPEGRYTMYVFGSEKGYGKYTYNNPINVHISFPTTDYTLRSEDTFFKKLEFTVTPEPIFEEIELERVVGKLEVKITDKIPDDIYGITISMSYAKSGSYFPYDNNPNNQVISRAFEVLRDVKTGKFAWDNEDLSFYFFLDRYKDVKVSVEISGWRYSDGRLVARKFIDDVPIGINQKTILTGKVFERPTGTEHGFTISVDPTWNKNVFRF